MIALLVAALPVLNAAELREVTRERWDEYTQAAEARLLDYSARGMLWIDAVPGRRSRVRDGEILASPAGGKSPVSIPHGLVHDWIGAVFVPNVSLEDVFAVVHDYEHYSTYFGPTIHSSQLLSRGHEGDDIVESFQVRYVRKALFVTAVFDAEYETVYHRLDDRRWYSTAHSRSIRQIVNHGEANERALPPDDGNGFLWRGCSFMSFEAADGGVYMEQESIALSTTIPFAYRWLVGPFVERLAKSLVTGWLGQTRAAAIAAARQKAGNSVSEARQLRGIPY